MNFNRRRRFNANRKYYRRRYKRRSKYSKYHYIPAISNKPITMGYGTTTINITRTKITNSSGQISTETLREMIYASEEFMLKMHEYMYFRVNFVKILIFPSQPLVVNATEALGNDVPINRNNYIYFNWARDDDTLSTTQIANSDNTKIVSCYLARNKVFTFIPPNFTYNGTSGTVNPTAFTNTEFNDYPGFIKFVFYNTMEVRMEINITFRGARDMNTAALIKNLTKLMNKPKKENKHKRKHKKDKEAKDEKKEKEVKEEEKKIEEEEFDWKQVTSSVDEDEN